MCGARSAGRNVLESSHRNMPCRNHGGSIHGVLSATFESVLQPNVALLFCYWMPDLFLPSPNLSLVQQYPRRSMWLERSGSTDWLRISWETVMSSGSGSLGVWECSCRLHQECFCTASAPRTSAVTLTKLCKWLLFGFMTLVCQVLTKLGVRSS